MTVKDPAKMRARLKTQLVAKQTGAPRYNLTEDDEGISLKRWPTEIYIHVEDGKYKITEIDLSEGLVPPNTQTASTLPRALAIITQLVS